jgi:hypothetical protein
VATTNDRPVWALENGLPSAHLVRAALRVARLIDDYGSPISAAEATYRLYPSGGLYPPEDLRLGERLLVDCDLLFERDGFLHPTAQLSELVALEPDEAASVVLERVFTAEHLNGVTNAPGSELAEEADALANELLIDFDRRETLLIAFRRKHDESARAAVGLRGEEFVVEVARAELAGLGRDDLALGVRRLSELSDDLGYDVLAPRFNGRRRLEVKTDGQADDELFHFYISRYAMEYGLLDPDWALVGCRLLGDDELELVGWCRAQSLKPYLPIDGTAGRWDKAEMSVPLTIFEPGLPPAI